MQSITQLAAQQTSLNWFIKEKLLASIDFYSNSFQGRSIVKIPEFRLNFLKRSKSSDDQGKSIFWNQVRKNFFRTNFTMEQIHALESLFEQTHYPDAFMREENREPGVPPTCQEGAHGRATRVTSKHRCDC
jgi:hypothetical protein